MNTKVVWESLLSSGKSEPAAVWDMDNEHGDEDKLAVSCSSVEEISPSQFTVDNRNYNDNNDDYDPPTNKTKREDLKSTFKKCQIQSQ